MRKVIIKVAVLTCVFIGAVVCFSLLTDTGNADLTKEMSEATLPVVSFSQGETAMNELYGYTTKMDEVTVRDTITPLNEDLILGLNIQTHQMSIEDISYEVRTLDMERLLENKEITDFENKEGNIKTDLQLQNLLKDDREYLFILTINANKDPIYYYTRVSKAQNSHITEAVEFAVDFHEKSHDPEQSAELSKYLEPTDDADNSTLQKVTIHSKLTQVAWADFNGTRVDKPVPSIKEIGNNDNTIILEYVMTTKGENGELQYYNVEEYFRVGYSDSLNRMALFNYERTMNQIFRAESQTISGNSLQLGIRKKQIEQMANETKTIVSFVQEGELWNYNANSNQLSYVYSFRGVDGINDRENIPWHDIKILEVDDAGNTDFVVLGYMNRGVHEGKSGISVYHYDAIANTIEEELFVSSDKSYHILKENWGKLFYISKDRKFYMIASDVLYKIDLESKKSSSVVTGLSEGTFSVSEDGRYIAWQDSEDTYHSEKIQVMDLEDESSHSIDTEKGEYIQPIGFIKNDFVYGIAKAEDITEDITGTKIFAMYKVLIMDKSLNIIMEYEKEGFYISHAYVEGDSVYLDRIVKDASGYVPAEQNKIKNHEADDENKLSIDSSSTDNKQTQIQFVFSEPLSVKSPQVLTPKEIVASNEESVELDENGIEDKYYVYSAGKMIYSTKSVKDAIINAEKQMGVVIDAKLNYIWEIGKSETVSSFESVILSADTGDMNTIKKCLMAMMQNEEINMDAEWMRNQEGTPIEILSEVLTERLVLDLSGCSLEEVLYYVYSGTPVFAKAEQDQAVLIVGYDKYNISLYNPETNSIYKVGRQDSEAMFEAAGNRFIGYINKTDF